MEVETTAAPAETGGEAGGGLDLQAMLDGVAPEQTQETVPAEPAPTPESKVEPQAEEKVEPVEAKAEESEPTDKTAEEYSEPLPGKLGKLLEAVAKTNPDLARQIRADHEALNGPEGFRGLFQTIEQAREYKNLAPTVDDLKVMADYAQRYDLVDRQYVSDPAGLIRTLAEDAPAFQKVAESFEPSLRQIGDDRLYESAAKPFNQNFWRNVMATVQREGLPEEVELFKQFEQKYLGGLAHGQSAPTSQFQNTPEWRELQQLRAERANHQGQSHESFFNDVNRDITPGLRAEVRKYLDEKATGLTEDIRDEMAGSIANTIFSEINGNPIVRSELQRMIEGGDLSPQHKQMVIDRVMTRAKAYLPTKSAPEIRRWSDRMRKLSGGNGNATTKTTTTTTRSKDVGSGSPSVGTPNSGPMPKGAPPGFNNMSQEDRARFVNWRAMGEDADQIFIEAQMSGDWSKVVMKGR